MLVRFRDSGLWNNDVVHNDVDDRVRIAAPNVSGFRTKPGSFRPVK